MVGVGVAFVFAALSSTLASWVVEPEGEFTSTGSAMQAWSDALRANELGMSADEFEEAERRSVEAMKAAAEATAEQFERLQSRLEPGPVARFLAEDLVMFSLWLLLAVSVIVTLWAQRNAATFHARADLAEQQQRTLAAPKLEESRSSPVPAALAAGVLVLLWRCARRRKR